MVRLFQIRALASTVLAATFGYSAFRKLGSRQATQESLREFGVPSRLIGAGFWALTIWEMMLTLGLLGRRTRSLAGVSALITLVTFTTGIVNHLIRGRRPRCGCFGGDSNSRVGVDSIMRNTTLTIFAMFAAGTSSCHLVIARGFISRHWLSTVVILEGLILIRLLRQFGMIIREISESRGQTAQRGDLVTLQNIKQRKELETKISELGNVSMLFLSEGCGHCENIVNKMIGNPESRSNLLLVHVGSEGSLEHLLEQNSFGLVIYDSDGSLSRDINVGAFPTLLSVGGDLKISADPILGGPMIEKSLGLTTK